MAASIWVFGVERRNQRVDEADQQFFVLYVQVQIATVCSQDRRNGIQQTDFDGAIAFFSLDIAIQDPTDVPCAFGDRN